MKLHLYAKPYMTDTSTIFLSRQRWSDILFSSKLPTSSSKNLLLQPLRHVLPGTSLTQQLLPSAIHLRRERQTFIPLPLSTASSGQKTVLFGVRTYLQQLITLPTDEIEAVVSIAEGWSDDMAAYKGRDAWLVTVKDYVKEIKDILPKK